MLQRVPENSSTCELADGMLLSDGSGLIKASGPWGRALTKGTEKNAAIKTSVEQYMMKLTDGR